MEAITVKFRDICRNGVVAFAAAQLILRPPGDIESVPQESVRADTSGQVYGVEPTAESPEPQSRGREAAAWSYNFKRVRHL